uniref:Uncharacterized protein n=1 Tax=Cuerna arida TaxID=1464854 RepID=A0A1B6EX81_9HEMI
MWLCVGKDVMFLNMNTDIKWMKRDGSVKMRSLRKTSLKLSLQPSPNMILTALFCNLNTLSNDDFGAVPQNSNPYARMGTKYPKYTNLSTCLLRKEDKYLNEKRELFNLEEMCSICVLHLKSLSTCNTKKFTDVDSGIVIPPREAAVSF